MHLECGGCRNLQPGCTLLQPHARGKQPSEISTSRTIKTNKKTHFTDIFKHVYWKFIVKSMDKQKNFPTDKRERETRV